MIGLPLKWGEKQTTHNPVGADFPIPIGDILPLQQAIELANFQTGGQHLLPKQAQ